MDHNLEQIITEFQIAGSLVSIEPLKMGHINDTYVSTWSSGKYVHQLINNYVFPNIPELMRNVQRITEHVSEKIETSPLAAQDRAVRLTQTKTGEYYLKTRNGQYWRTYECVPNARSYYVCANEVLAHEAAETCGRFQRYISDLNAQDFFVVINDFHNTEFRYKQLQEALNSNLANRAASVKSELDFVFERESEGSLIMRSLEAGELTWRVTHNDLKYNNVLFDLDSQKGVAIVDLDTCMPGTLMFDFGDLVRNASVQAGEDETDLSKVFLRMSYFEALAEGYLGQLKDSIQPLEWELMPLAPKLLTLTIGIRFLTDYINGDKYFKVGHSQQNLDRARNQFQIVRSMEQQQDEMKRVVERVRKAH